jgi:hypothetical protein
MKKMWSVQIEVNKHWCIFGMAEAKENLEAFISQAAAVSGVKVRVVEYSQLKTMPVAKCKRLGCENLFQVNRRGRKFCSYRCAHHVAVNASRRRVKRQQIGKQVP